MTYLQSLHPYPAMIADALAALLAERYVSGGELVLDPFCGTGRTLAAAAERGAVCLGVDVNPLAVLLARSKAGLPRASILSQILNSASAVSRRAPRYDLQPGRRVQWFTPNDYRDLCNIVYWLNEHELEGVEASLLASVLSATVRDVSLSRKGQWKIHRITTPKKTSKKKNAWDIFKRRLNRLLLEISNAQVARSIEAIRGDARVLSQVIPETWKDRVDIVLTSPPYGDSRTTVGYGGMSGLCLGVVRNLKFFNEMYLSSGAIDRLCLGGGSFSGPAPLQGDDLRPFWSGELETVEGARVMHFFNDLWLCCNEIANVLRPGGIAVFVVSRRNVAGETVLLDTFLHYSLGACGMKLEGSFERDVTGKRTPLVINRKARGIEADRATSCVPTMTAETVLAFKKY